MIGEFPAAADGDHFRAVPWIFVLFGAAAGGVDGVVLEQHYGVTALAGHDLIVNLLLQLQAGTVVHEIRGETNAFEVQSHSVSLSLESACG